jgi:hypothetical protein
MTKCNDSGYSRKFTLTELQDLNIGATQEMPNGCGANIGGTAGGSGYSTLINKGFGWPDNEEFEWGGLGSGCAMCSFDYGCDNCTGGGTVSGKRGTVKRKAFKGDPLKCCINKQKLETAEINSLSKAGGGSGGTLRTFKCPGNAFITKISGRAGSRIDQLQFTCSDGTKSPTFGGNGGNLFGPHVSDVGFGGARGRAGSKVDQLRFVKFMHGEVFGSHGGSRGDPVDLTCQKPVVGVNIRSGSEIDNLQFICGKGPAPVKTCDPKYRSLGQSCDEYMLTHCKTNNNWSSPECMEWVQSAVTAGRPSANVEISTYCSQGANFKNPECQAWCGLVRNNPNMRSACDSAVQSYCNNNKSDPNCACMAPPENVTKIEDMMATAKVCWYKPCKNLINDNYITSNMLTQKNNCVATACLIEAGDISISGADNKVNFTNNCATNILKPEYQTGSNTGTPTDNTSGNNTFPSNSSDNTSGTTNNTQDTTNNTQDTTKSGSGNIISNLTANKGLLFGSGSVVFISSICCFFLLLIIVFIMMKQK